MCLLAGNVGRDLEPRDMRRRARFEIHALPDTADRTVPALFAVRNLGEWILGEQRGIVAWVDHAHNQLIWFVVMQRGAGVELERQVAALVLAKQLAVEPDPRVVIDGAKVKIDCRLLVCFTNLQSEICNLKLLAVPRHATIVAQIFELRLPGAGNQDRTRLGCTGKCFSAY